MIGDEMLASTDKLFFNYGNWRMSAGNKIRHSDFFFSSKGCSIEYYFGSLQGTNHSSDSVNSLGFGDFYCKESYEIIFLYKDLITRKELGFNTVKDIFSKGQQLVDTFKDFECYAFIYPQRDPELQEDIHEMNIKFPVEVKAYKRFNHQWRYVGKTRTKTFEELSEFQFKTIYQIK